jgi:hypothetical protein
LTFFSNPLALIVLQDAPPWYDKKNAGHELRSIHTTSPAAKRKSSSKCFSTRDPSRKDRSGGGRIALVPTRYLRTRVRLDSFNRFSAALTALLIPLDFLFDGCHAYFTGFTRVPAAEVAIAYLRAISTPITGRILKLHKTDS